MPNNPALPKYAGDGLSYYYEDGQLVVVNSGSGNLCNPGAMTAWMEARDKNDAATKKAERAEAAQVKHKQKVEDYKVLGPVIGQLAQLIRSNRSAAEVKKSVGPAVLKRNKRRRRLKAD